MRRVLPLLAIVLLAGCAQEPPLPPAGEPITSGTTEADGFRLTGKLTPASITPGEMADATFTLLNAAANASYESGGCGPTPWRFEIVAPNGTIVGPLGPDPRCLGPPTRDEALPTGANLTATLRWDGMVKRYDDSYEIQRTPAAPGLYTLRASMELARGDERAAPSLELQLRVV